MDPTWYGDPIGHWEGDTLVVDTIGFNDKTELPGGYGHTEALHVVERFRRVTFDHLDYQIAGRILDRFKAHFGQGHVFMDVDGNNQIVQGDRS